MGGKLCFFRLPDPNSWNNLPAALKWALTLFGVWTLLILFFFFFKRSLSCVKWAQAVAGHCCVWLKSLVLLSPDVGKAPLSQLRSWWLGTQGQTDCSAEQGHTYTSEATASLCPDFPIMDLGFWSCLAWTERLRADLCLVWGVGSSGCSSIRVLLHWIRGMELKQELSAGTVPLYSSDMHIHIRVQCVLNVWMYVTYTPLPPLDVLLNREFHQHRAHCHADHVAGNTVKPKVLHYEGVKNYFAYCLLETLQSMCVSCTDQQLKPFCLCPQFTGVNGKLVRDFGGHHVTSKDELLF